MEDRSVVQTLLEGQYLLAACLDGFNGSQVSEEVAKILPKVVSDNLKARWMRPDLALLRSLREIDQYVKQKPPPGPQQSWYSLEQWESQTHFRILRKLVLMFIAFGWQTWVTAERWLQSPALKLWEMTRTLSMREALNWEPE